MSDAIGGLMDIEQAALELSVEYGETAIVLLQFILWPILGRPADMEPGGKVLTRETPAQLAAAAIARAA